MGGYGHETVDSALLGNSEITPPYLYTYAKLLMPSVSWPYPPPLSCLAHLPPVPRRWRACAVRRCRRSRSPRPWRPCSSSRRT